jgi:hypothetical protein
MLSAVPTGLAEGGKVPYRQPHPANGASARLKCSCLAVFGVRQGQGLQPTEPHDLSGRHVRHFVQLYLSPWRKAEKEEHGLKDFGHEF